MTSRVQTSNGSVSVLAAQSVIGIALLVSSHLGCASPGRELARATAEFDAHHYAEAARLCRQFIAAHPDHAAGHAVLGFTLLELDHTDEAEASFRRSVELDARLIQAHVGLGQVARRAGDLAASRAHYRRGLEVSPDDPILLGGLAVVECMEGRYAEAIRLCERAMRLAPDNAAIVANLSIAYHYTGDREARDRYYRIAIEHGYESGDALAAIFRGDTGVGPGTDISVLPSDPDQAGSVRGWRAYRRREFEQAAAEFDALTGRRPDIARHWISLGFAMLELDRVPEGEHAFRRAEALEPGLADVWLGLGRVHRAREEYPEAMAAYRRALTIAPDDWRVIGSMAAALLATGDYDEAVRLGELAEHSALHDPTTLANLSIAYHFIGRVHERDATYERALAAGYHNGPALLEIFAGRLAVGPGPASETP